MGIEVSTLVVSRLGRTEVRFTFPRLGASCHHTGLSDINITARKNSGITQMFLSNIFHSSSLIICSISTFPNILSQHPPTTALLSAGFFSFFQTPSVLRQFRLLRSRILPLSPRRFIHRALTAWTKRISLDTLSETLRAARHASYKSVVAVGFENRGDRAVPLAAPRRRL